MSKRILIFTFCLSLFTSVYGTSVDSFKVIEEGGVLEVHIFTDASQYKDFTTSPKHQNYSMIVLDFFNTRHNLPTNWVSVMKGDLLKIRSSQFTTRITRVVLDVKQIEDYRIYSKENGIVVCLGKLGGQAKGLTTKTNVRPDEGIFYSSRGKRDPFKPLVRSRKKVDMLLDVENAVLQGIMWSPKERYALLQDGKGKGYTLREGDKVSGGKVLSIRKKEVIFELYGFGKVRRVTLKITSKEKK